MTLEYFVAGIDWYLPPNMHPATGPSPVAAGILWAVLANNLLHFRPCTICTQRNTFQQIQPLAYHLTVIITRSLHRRRFQISDDLWQCEVANECHQLD